MTLARVDITAFMRKDDSVLLGDGCTSRSKTSVWSVFSNPLSNLGAETSSTTALSNTPVSTTWPRIFVAPESQCRTKPVGIKAMGM